MQMSLCLLVSFWSFLRSISLLAVSIHLSVHLLVQLSVCLSIDSVVSPALWTSVYHLSVRSLVRLVVCSVFYLSDSSVMSSCLESAYLSIC
jgi:hypothetical protein